MKVLAIFGTRPEAIKLAPVIKELGRRAKSTALDTVVCVTAQHRQMLDQVLDLFEVSVDYDLDIMGEDQTPTRVASDALSSLEPVLQKERPDWVLVQGDTTTVVAASLAAFYAKTCVAHVEAGLRTQDKWLPFPEETNRRIAGVIADLHLAPTPWAQRNLIQEGVPADRVLVTGNPVIDALFQVVEQSPPDNIQALLDSVPVREQSGSARLVLVTAHRRENFGAPLESIAQALKDLAARYGSQLRIVYPVHPNPNVWGPVHRLLDGVPNITLLKPLDYLSLAHLMRRSYMVITDSGGIQEEAPALGKPVLVLRDATERPEAVAAGTVKLIGTDRQRIVAEAEGLLDDPSEYRRMARAVNPYGDGLASQRIVSALLEEPVEQFTPDDASTGQ